MKVINATNVNNAYAQGLALLRAEGVREDSRAGPVLVAPTPVTTVYERPRERVLFDPVRDANPFFHLFEALHMLAGRNDATWLDRFVGNFSSRFAEDNGHQHGAYGFRWRNHFDMEGGGHPTLPDQINTVVRLLRENLNDRRAVLTMWDPVADLGADRRDVPCNLLVLPRIRQEGVGVQGMHGEPLNTGSSLVLDITVCCRSNDAIWGAYGANAVHFSVLQEYLAGRIGVGVGRYYQCSNNFHAYVDVLEKVGKPSLEWQHPYGKFLFLPAVNQTCQPAPMGTNWVEWDRDLHNFMAWTEEENPLDIGLGVAHYVNSWFADTAEPLYAAHWCWKRGFKHDAFTILDNAEGIAADWLAAARMWFKRRMDK